MLRLDPQEPVSVWDLKRPLTQSCFLGEPGTLPSVEWIGKEQYLELLKAPCLSALDELLSPSASAVGVSELTVGRIHAVIAKDNLVQVSEHMF